MADFAYDTLDPESKRQILKRRLEAAEHQHFRAAIELEVPISDNPDGRLDEGTQIAAARKKAQMEESILSIREKLNELPDS